MRSTNFPTENYFHIFNRGVDKRQIFMNNRDYERFLHNMYELNNVENTIPYVARLKGSTIRHPVANSIVKKKKLVDIIAFCLMPNHFHLILKSLVEGGISLFIKKLCGGYSCYFNLENDRSGALFQGRFKAKLIGTDAQIMHLIRYIHILNPGELIEPEIRKGIIRNPVKLKAFLKEYKWSSHLDYLGIKNYPSLTNRTFISSYFNDIMDYERFMMSWKVNDLEKINSILIK